MSFFSRKSKQQNNQVPWSQRRLSIPNLFPRFGHSANQSGVNDEIYIFGGNFKRDSIKDVFFLENKKKKKKKNGKKKKTWLAKKKNFRYMKESNNDC